MAKQLFVNLPVKDLQTTTAFFAKLGFAFNPKFTDENAACMVITENTYAMLLLEKFFKTFIKKELADAKKTTEVLLALQLGSREQVDEMVAKAKAAGGQEPNAMQDHGWMYSRSFEDPDGHIWEVFCMDESQMPKQ